jgi:hypothetical protein
MKTPEEIAEEIIFNAQASATGWVYTQSGERDQLRSAIAAAIRAEREELERLKQGVQQIAPLATVGQIVRQQEEIDRLKAELERVTSIARTLRAGWIRLKDQAIAGNGPVECFAFQDAIREEDGKCVEGAIRARQQLRECWSVLEASREAMRQLVNLANVNPTIRSMLQSLGNSFNNLLLKHQKGETK